MRSINRCWIVLTSLILISGCAGLGHRMETPRVTLVSINSADIQLLEQRYALTLRIQNPNQDAMEIKGLSFDLELNGESFAQGVSNQAVSVGPFDEALIQVTVSSGLLNIINQLNVLDRRRGEQLAYRISGKVSVAGQLRSIPFERKGQLGTKAPAKLPKTNERRTT